MGFHKRAETGETQAASVSAKTNARMKFSADSREVSMPVPLQRDKRKNETKTAAFLN
jgi:hypothetical protein